MNKKTLREERTAAEWKNVAQQPAAGGESRKRDSFLVECYNYGYHELLKRNKTAIGFKNVLIYCVHYAIFKI